MQGAGLITLAFLLLAAPFGMLADWFKFIKNQPRGQQELAKASHGAGVLMLLVYWFNSGASYYVTPLLRLAGPLGWMIVVATAAWGIGWFCLNAGFAARALVAPERGTIIARSLIKIAIGCVVWICAGLLGVLDFAFVPRTVAVWCLTTGGTKFLLMVWGGGRAPARPLMDENIQASEFTWERYGRGER